MSENLAAFHFELHELQMQKNILIIPKHVNQFGNILSLMFVHINENKNIINFPIASLVQREIFQYFLIPACYTQFSIQQQDQDS